ncbi:CFEM domain-containing protein [Colletotrichum orchidophilum]|uniref:CFEM domain-containing protein n=1 Tax=Colletotrichum orchidophilum TaxID=1209926 RepID=A0A1G4AY20_9PEZI|nr:CFEM domain-containing protein [Colletotrichum orchidophilum]OHE94049.1 CFEM domain-containing protein [Colletotrichum orchidophilum]
MALQLADGLPGCAIPCLSQVINITTCAAANLTASFIKNMSMTACGYPSHHQTGSALEITPLVVVTAIFFLARLLSKFLRLSTWGLDDFTLILGYACTTSFAISKFIGIGRDIWTLTYDEITRFMQVFFAYEIIYTLSISALKASILFFYTRVFSIVSCTFNRVLWCTQAFNLLFCLAFTVANLNQCQPLKNSWEGWDGRHPGYCVNIYAMIMTHAVINIVLDVWLMGLPITQVVWLNMRKRQKIEIVVMFGLGIFITVVSAIRLSVLLNLRGFQDPTYDAFFLHKWSYIELSVSVIVACLPATRQVWRHVVPKFLRLVGLGTPLHHGHERPGDSKRKLRDILFLSTNKEQSAGPSSPNGSSSYPPV